MSIAKISSTVILITALLLSIFCTNLQAFSVVSPSGFGSKNHLLDRNTYVIFDGRRIHIMDLFNDLERCGKKLSLSRQDNESADAFARRKSKAIAYCKDLNDPVVTIIEKTTLDYQQSNGVFSFELPNIDHGGSGWIQKGQKSTLMSFKFKPRSTRYKIYADNRYFTGKWQHSGTSMIRFVDIYSHAQGAKQLQSIQDTLQTRYIGTLRIYKTGTTENPLYNFNFLLNSIVVYSVTENADIVAIDLL